jgi:hypothetical protein
MTPRNQRVATLAEVPVSAPRRSRRVSRLAPRGVLPGPSSTDRATREWAQSNPRALSEARRAGNRAHIDAVRELRCECTVPNCSEMLPAAAALHRKDADQFIVAPAHFAGCTVIRAADRFFVVESPEYTGNHSRSNDG